MDISKHIIGVEMPDHLVEAYFKKLMEGDPRCRIPIGSRVRKVFMFADNEINPIGSEGTVVGSMYREEPEFTKYGVNHDMYLVNFDNSPKKKDIKIKLKEKMPIVQIGIIDGMTTACHGVKLLKL